MKRKNLLFILDDDPFYTAMLCSHLSKYDFEITSFTSIKECIENLWRHPFLLLLDLNLDDEHGPLRSGKDVFKKIKESYPEIQMVIISNQDSGPVVLDLIQHGVRNYVEKDSNTFKNLDSIISSILSKGIFEED